MVWAEIINTESYFLHRERESFTMNEPKTYFYEYVIAKVSLGEMKENNRYEKVSIMSSQDGKNIIIRSEGTTLYIGSPLENTVATTSCSKFFEV